MSFSEWREVKFQDITINLDNKRVPLSSRVRENRKGKYPYYGAQGIVDYIDDYIFDGEYLLIAEDGENLKSKKQNVANLAKGKFWVNNHAHVILNNDLSDLHFLYYIFNSIDIAGYITGSAQPKLSQQNLNKIKLVIPPLPEQKAIAATLSALDDMIELNNQINKTLEEMAQAIFKSWFVDFEPFKDGEFEESELGLIPKGWRVGCIGDYVKVKSGFAFKSSWWETSGVPVIKIKEIDNYTINFGDVSYVSEDKAALAKDFRVNGGDLLIAMTGATIGKFAIVPKMPSFAVVNQRVGKFFLGDNPLEKLGFIYCILKQDNVYKEIVSRGEGSAQPNISPSGIESIKIVLPPERLINEYNQLVMKFFKMIIENTAENALLICLRDTLLPKLMSGEIRVPVEEVV